MKFFCSRARRARACDQVARVKNKWKCILKDGMIHVNGKDYLFAKCTGWVLRHDRLVLIETEPELTSILSLLRLPQRIRVVKHLHTTSSPPRFSPHTCTYAQPCPLPALSLSRLSIPCFLSLVVALHNYCTDMTCLSIPTCLSNPSFAVGLVTPNHTKVRVKKSRSITPQPWKRRCTENIRKKID